MDDDNEFDIDYHLRHLALPRPGRVWELLVLVSHLHASNRPLWECYLIKCLADVRFALYLKMHHGLVDGVTGLRMISAALSTVWRDPSCDPSLGFLKCAHDRDSDTALDGLRYQVLWRNQPARGAGDGHRTRLHVTDLVQP